MLQLRIRLQPPLARKLRISEPGCVERVVRLLQGTPAAELGDAMDARLIPWVRHVASRSGRREE